MVFMWISDGRRCWTWAVWVCKRHINTFPWEGWMIRSVLGCTFACGVVEDVGAHCWVWVGVSCRMLKARESSSKVSSHFWRSTPHSNLTWGTFLSCTIPRCQLELALITRKARDPKPQKSFLINLVWSSRFIDGPKGWVSDLPLALPHTSSLKLQAIH